jgi:leucyl aminopeptidase
MQRPLPKIEFAAGAVKDVGTVVLGWFHEDAGEDDSKGTVVCAGRRDKAVDALAARLRQSRHFKGNKGETDILRYYAFEGFDNVLNLGLGPAKKWDLETVRHVGAACYQAQKKGALPTLVVRHEMFPAAEGASFGDTLQAFAEGYLLASYEFQELKSKGGSKFHPKGLVLVGLGDAAAKKAVERATKLAEAVCLARRLGDLPANHMTPALFAKEALAVAKKSGLKAKVLGRAELERERMGLILGVGKGSAEEPKLVVLEYAGGKKGDRPVALVGKGITFDTGGISIKPAAAMEEMKYDMMGAATVLGTMQAIAALEVPVNVVGFLALAENMPSGEAQKPGDVAKSRSGKTVEITNTDAEGRLVLADALEYAQERHPQAIMDFATLTGAVIVALGTVTTGIMGTSRELIERIKSSATVTGERVWELPLYDEYFEDLKSPVADLRNSGNREAGSSKGGMFLKFFVDDKVPWVHFDIAGSAWHRKDVPYHPAKHASGVMVRLVTHLLSQWRTLGK